MCMSALIDYLQWLNEPGHEQQKEEFRNEINSIISEPDHE